MPAVLRETASGFAVHVYHDETWEPLFTDGPVDQFPLFHGSLSDGEPFTLHRVVVHRGSGGFGEGSEHWQYELFPSAISVGAHLSVCELEIRGVHFSLPQLAPWFGYDPVIPKFDEDGGLTIRIQAEDFEAFHPLPDGSGIEAIPTRSHNFQAYHSVHYSVGLDLGISFSEPKSLIECEHIVRQCGQIFSLASFMDMGPTAFTGDSCFRYIWAPQAERGDAAPRQWLLLSYKDVKGILPDWFRALWIELETRPAFATMICDFLKAPQSPEVSYLLMTQALENYCRHTLKMPGKKQGNLKLDRCIRQLLEPLPVIVRSFFTGGDDDRFIKEIVQTRTFWAHALTERPPQAIEDHRLEGAARSLALLIVCSLMVRAGFPVVKLHTKLYGNPQRRSWENPLGIRARIGRKT